MKRRAIGLLKQLGTLLARGELHLDPATCEKYSGDKWFAAEVPEAVVTPRSVPSVAATLKFASRHGIPVTTRGAGYGYVGGCVPVRRGIVLSMEKLRRIRRIDPRDFVAVVQPGVVTKDLQDAVERHGLFYPPDPASRADCSIGGNIATNAGGPRCLKYGVTRDYVLGLEVVLADGSVVDLGSRTHKNKTGFDLHRMFVGSEGLLGVITEATLKLLPLPEYRACLLVGFASMKAAVRCIRAVFEAGFLPSALEVADEFTLAAAAARTGSRLFEGCHAHLIIEIDGRQRSVRSEVRELTGVVKPFDPVFVNRGFGQDGCEQIWQVRREFSYSLRDTGLTKLNQDVVVPRGRLEDLFRFAVRLQKKHQVRVACFGHSGDGNIHVNLMIDRDSPTQVERGDQAVDELFKQVLKWGGVVTGEHGIGVARQPWWSLAASKGVRDLHHRVKTSLDPKGILNPGKFA